MKKTTMMWVFLAAVGMAFGCSDDPQTPTNQEPAQDMATADSQQNPANNGLRDGGAADLDPTPDLGADTAGDAALDLASDAAGDGGADAESDVAADVAADLPPDASEDLSGDSGMDAAADMQADLAQDMAPDAPLDVGPDAPADMGPTFFEPPSLTVAGADHCFPESRTIDITATASDPAGGTLSYAWKTSGGSLTGTGATVKFSPAQPQPMVCMPYVIQVLAKSSVSGLQTAASVSVYVPTLGDVNGDGEVDAGDQTAVQAAWGNCTGCPEDLNNDGTVGASDLNVVLGQFGNTGCACGDMPTVSLSAYMNCFHERRDSVVDLATSATMPTVTWTAVGGTATPVGASAKFVPDPTTPGTCQENTIAVKVVPTTGTGAKGWLDFTIPVLGDADGDGTVAVGDLNRVLADFGPCDDAVCLSDVNGNGQVENDDRNGVTNVYWGNTGCACF